jgi:hypothetical protein
MARSSATLPGTDDEIGRLAHTMNDMLARLEDSAARQRRTGPPKRPARRPVGTTRHRTATGPAA